MQMKRFKLKHIQRKRKDVPYEQGVTRITLSGKDEAARVEAGEPWSYDTLLRVSLMAPEVNVVYEDEDILVADLPRSWVTLTRYNPDRTFTSWSLAPKSKG